MKGLKALALGGLIGLTSCANINPSRTLTENEIEEFKKQSPIEHCLKQTDNLGIYSVFYLPKDIADVPFSLANGVFIKRVVKNKHVNQLEAGGATTGGGIIISAIGAVHGTIWGSGLMHTLSDCEIGLGVGAVGYGVGLLTYPYTLSPIESYLLRGPYDGDHFNKKDERSFEFFPNYKRYKSLKELDKK